MPPLVVDYRHRHANKDIEATSVHDMEANDGTRIGICPLTVHGLTGEQYVNESTETLKIIVMEHLTGMGKFVAIGHAEELKKIHPFTQRCFHGYFHIVLEILETNDTKV